MTEDSKKILEATKTKYPDLSVYSDGTRLYTKDNITSGLYRFVEFQQAFADGTFDGITDPTPLNPGVFKKNPNGWDIKAACTWLHQHAGADSQHVCAKYVRMAIEAGGIPTTGRPNWAWKYIDYLPTIGFKFLCKVGRDQMGSFRAEPGDIAVYQKGGDPSVPGHICMWTGNEWASDFKQRNMIVYQATPEAYIFRFQ